RAEDVTLGAGGREYRFRIRNHGQAAASELRAWLINDQDVQVTGHKFIGMQGPGEAGEIKLEVPDNVPAGTKLRLQYKWKDDRPGDDHTHISNIDVPEPEMSR